MNINVPGFLNRALDRLLDRPPPQYQCKEEDVKINFAREFSRFPAGRFPEDGEFNGEAFREDHLLPAYEKAKAQGGKVVVAMDDVFGLSGSFLQEAFGGFAKVLQERENVELSRDIMELVAEEGFYQIYFAATWRYIGQALDGTEEKHAPRPLMKKSPSSA